MLRQDHTRSFCWADKTLSMLKAKQLEACGKYLAGLSSRSLFDSDSTDEHAEYFFDLSYYKAEEKVPVLHTIEGLRTEVLTNFPAEVTLLTQDEYELLMKLVLLGGRLPLRDPYEADPARSMVRRPWCKVEKEGSGLILQMPRSLCMSAVVLMSSEEHQRARELVEATDQAIDDTLYLLGATSLSAPLEHLRSALQATFLGDQPRLIRRMLLAGYDYIIDQNRQTLLIHPGVAEPWQLSHHAFETAGLTFMSEQALADALNSLEDIEDPLFDRLSGLLTDTVRPEADPENVAEDLLLLAKQNVSLPDLTEVLKSQLITVPSLEMLRVLREIHDQVPRWLFLSSSLVQ